MIVSFRDKRTREFAGGNRVKAFTEFERKAEIKLDQLDAATSLLDLDLPGNRLEALKGTARANTAYASMTDGGFASGGPKARRGRSMLRSSITIERCIMARTAIHPGEHLAEQLEELGMSAAELARQSQGAHQPHHGDSQRPARHNRRHGPAPGAFLRNEPGILAESPENL